MNRKNISALMHLAMLSMIDSESNEEINWEYVKNEYALVKAKKSNLYRREREWIVNRWEEKIKECQPKKGGE
jgi:hypothetical protein